MPSNHLILCRPLLLPSIFPNIRVFSNESALGIRWPKYWSFSFNISPSNEHPGLISFRMDWLDLLAVQGTLESSPSPQFKSINSSALSFLYSPTLTSIHDHWKNCILAPLIIRNWSEARTKIQARVYWGPCHIRGEWEQTSSLACLQGWRWTSSLHGVRVGVGPRVGPKGWLRCFAHSFGDVECRGHAQQPAFAPKPLLFSRLFNSGSWVFWFLCIFFSRICPNSHTPSYF